MFDGCGESSLVELSSCSSVIAERFGDGGSGLWSLNREGLMLKGCWMVSFVGGSCECPGLYPMSGSDGVEEVLLGGGVVCC